MTKCSQCDKPAVVSYEGFNLCVEHHLMMQQAIYLRAYLVSKQLDFVESELENGSGGLIRRPRMNMASPPFIGGNLTLHNINIDGSTIGSINTGTIRNLDASITLMQSRGENDLAAGIKELTEVIIQTKEIAETAKKDLSEQLEFLVTQLTAKKENRSLGSIKSILSGIKDAVSISAGLLTIWDKVEPLMRAAFGL